MGYRCYNCGKGSDYGHNVSHAKNRTLRQRKPNLHRAMIMKDGSKVKVLLRTKCLRTADRFKKVVKNTDVKEVKKLGGAK